MIDISKVYTSKNCGDYVITKYEGCNKVHIRFLKTGFCKTIQTGDIKRGGIKDPTYPSVYGVGFIGVGIHKTKKGLAHTKAGQHWRGMLERAYCDKYHSKSPTYKNVSVCDDWHNFQVFAEWFNSNYIKGFHLDKDIKQRGSKAKVYSPSTCLFVSAKGNAIESSVKEYKFISPSGLVVKIQNLSKFCDLNNLNRNCMYGVNNGNVINHKGWSKP